MKMKLFYGIILILMVFISACAQQEAAPEAPPVTTPEPSSEPVAPAEPDQVAPETEEVTAPSGGEVRMLGVGQYEPAEVTISAGGSVTFFNEGKIKTVMTIKGPSGVTNSPIVMPGEKYEQAFDEVGEYDAWAISYGPGVKVTVE